MVPAPRRQIRQVGVLLATGLLVSAVAASGLAGATADPATASTTSVEATNVKTATGEPTTVETANGETSAVDTATGSPATLLDPTLDVAASEAPPDPPGDPLGWENGYWYNESINVSQADGLTESERERFLARTMARVERLRGLEFEANVSLRFVARDRFREGFRNETLPPAVDSEELQDSFTLTEGFWEALFFYGEETSAEDAIRRFGSEAILAYSAEEGFQNEVIVVTASEASPAVSESVLAHELVHALQGQHYDFDAPRYRPETHDGRLAKDGLVEGAAAYVDHLYEGRCGTDWDCVRAPGNWAGSEGLEGIAYPFVVAHPYADGASLVHDIVREGDWSAVSDRHRALPNSTEQVIHRNREPVRSIDATDASTDAWRLEASERVGEASIYLMFWRAASQHDPDPVPPSEFRDGTADYDSLDYTGTPSSGWGADRLLLYRNGEEGGYVWTTIWDSPTDAREFELAYRSVLTAYGAEQTGTETWVIPEDRIFRDAFHVDRDGTTVRIVNAPTVEALADLAPWAEVGAGPTATDLPSTTTPPAEYRSRNELTTDSTSGTPSPRATTSDGQGPGFGFWPAVVAAGLALGWLRLRSGDLRWR